MDAKNQSKEGNRVYSSRLAAKSLRAKEIKSVEKKWKMSKMK